MFSLGVREELPESTGHYDWNINTRDYTLKVILNTWTNIIIVIILMQITSGIIIDAFANLRD